jgi:hypothetical protein
LELFHFLSEVTRGYAQAVGGSLEVIPRDCPPTPLGTSVSLPFRRYSGSSREDFSRLVATHCTIIWLIHRLNQLHIDVCLSQGWAESAPVPLVFELPDNPTLGVVLNTVKSVLAEHRPRRTRSSAASAILTAHVPTRGFRIGKTTINISSLMRTGEWEAKTILLEARDETIVSVHSDRLDGQTIADLFRHTNAYLLEGSSVLATEISLQPPI